MSCRGQVR